MNSDQLTYYIQTNWLFIALALFFVYRFYSQYRVRKLLPNLLAKGAVIVDVRGAGEFASGCNPKSINIPLNELAARTGELDQAKPIILCCASGTRSAMAVRLLKAKGFKNALNGGPWKNTL